MKRFLFLVMSLALAGTAVARDTAPAPALTEADRGPLTRIVVDTWASHVDAEHLERWLANVEQRAESVPLTWLEGAAAALDLRSVDLALDGLAPLDTPTPAAFGAAGGNLVFTPITPCRLLDTRQPSPRSGIIAGDSQRTFYAYDVNFQSQQGGANSDCGLPLAVRPEALAVTLAAVNPTGNGYLTAYPVGSELPLAASLNYTAGSVTSTGLILPINNEIAVDDFAIYSRRDTHVVADVTGYFSRPEAAPLDCMTMTGPAVQVAPGAVEYVASPACPATHRGMYGGCLTVASDAVPFSAHLVGVSGQTECGYRNSGTTTMSVRAVSNCCRIPGR